MVSRGLEYGEQNVAPHVYRQNSSTWVSPRGVLCHLYRSYMCIQRGRRMLYHRNVHNDEGSVPKNRKPDHRTLLILPPRSQCLVCCQKYDYKRQHLVLLVVYISVCSHL
ncbi:hypothetical protein GDO81_022774 [Engystomops pustulosus]|uniref:Uncharacterized protein n=1 Tax=Engystomops pustulosus TaxID=76066 RepID=A0AAV6ZP62_ENGPU|nr:hypothetical protein GDO81_022774 [Engystomops pustulosus]